MDLGDALEMNLLLMLAAMAIGTMPSLATHRYYKILMANIGSTIKVGIGTLGGDLTATVNTGSLSPNQLKALTKSIRQIRS